MCAARDIDVTPAGSQPFQLWQQAAAALEAAETRGAPHDEIIRLSTEVIRARNAVTVDRLHAGWRAPDDILSRLSADDQLLHEKDDASQSTPRNELPAPEHGRSDDRASS